MQLASSFLLPISSFKLDPVSKSSFECVSLLFLRPACDSSVWNGIYAKKKKFILISGKTPTKILFCFYSPIGCVCISVASNNPVAQFTR